MSLANSKTKLTETLMTQANHKPKALPFVVKKKAKTHLKK